MALMLSRLGRRSRASMSHPQCLHLSFRTSWDSLAAHFAEGSNQGKQVQQQEKKKTEVAVKQEVKEKKAPSEQQEQKKSKPPLKQEKERKTAQTEQPEQKKNKAALKQVVKQQVKAPAADGNKVNSRTLSQGSKETKNEKQRPAVEKKEKNEALKDEDGDKKKGRAGMKRDERRSTDDNKERTSKPDARRKNRGDEEHYARRKNRGDEEHYARRERRDVHARRERRDEHEESNPYARRERRDVHEESNRYARRKRSDDQEDARRTTRATIASTARSRKDETSEGERTNSREIRERRKKRDDDAFEEEDRRARRRSVDDRYAEYGRRRPRQEEEEEEAGKEAWDDRPRRSSLGNDYRAWSNDRASRSSRRAGYENSNEEDREVEFKELRELRNREEEYYREPSFVDTGEFGDLLRRCGRTKDLAEGRRLHAHLAQGYYDRDTYLGNLLVQMYGNCGKVEDARDVFDKLDERNVFSFNIMLAAYTQNGHLEKAREIFDQNPDKSVVSWNSMVAAYAQRGQLDEARSLFDSMTVKNVVSWTGMLQAYAQNGRLEDAKGIFDEMPDRDIVTWNTMLSAYAQKGMLDEVRSLFERMLIRDRVTWTAMISALSQNGRGQEALEYYYRMILEGIQPNKVTCISVLEACGSSRSLAVGKALHAQFVENGLESDVAIETALVSMYSKSGSLRDAQKMFDKMPDRDVITWTTMVQAYANEGQIDNARVMFNVMPNKNVISWNTMMIALVQVGSLDEARGMFERMPDKNVVSWTTMITGYAQMGQGKEALKFYGLMELHGFFPDRTTFASVLNACASIPAPLEGRIIHRDIVANGLQNDYVISTSLLSMYSSCGHLQLAISLFDGIQHKDDVCWTAMITAYLHNGHGARAVEMFRGMLVEGMQPNSITFISLFSACSHVGVVDDGRSYFSMMEDYGMSPWLDHYLCMIDLLGRAGQLDKAEELIETMPFQPVPGAWRTLLAASRLHKDDQRAYRAAKRATELDPEAGAHYILLSNVHAEAGNNMQREADDYNQRQATDDQTLQEQACF